MCSNWFFSSSSIRLVRSFAFSRFFIIIIGSISMEINSKTWLGTSAKYYAINTRMPTQFSPFLFLACYYLPLSLLLLLLMLHFVRSHVSCFWVHSLFALKFPIFFRLFHLKAMDMSCLQIESDSGRARERKLHSNEKQTSYQTEPRRKKKIKLLIYHK